jgi:tetratricopeptide (TPR) repeat protein
MTRERKDNRRVLKWVGYLTAILSLCGTMAGVAKYVYDRAETRKNAAALLATEAEQAKAHDYRSGWTTLEKAVRVDPDSAAVRAAQEKLAMAWLEDIHLQENEKFSDVTEKLEPVLARAVATSKPGPRQADLRAHIGWAYFLESRDGRSGLDPAGPYREAATEDPHNPYAQAMWGHWILWQHCGRIEEARDHFAAALASQREGDYVRRLEMAALLNCHDDQSDLEVVRVANDMRNEHRTLDEATREQILFIYQNQFTPPTAETQEFIHAVPPAEHVATFRWLFGDPGSDDASRWSRAYYLGALEEAAGQRADALANYRLVLSHVPHDSTQWQAADAGAKRLSRLH